MAKQYKWKTTFIYQNQHDPNYHLSHGVTPATYDTWQTADVGVAGSNSATYYYRDSNTMYSGGWYDTISSQVNFSVSQSWSTSTDSRNNLIVTVTTTINSIARVDAQGGDQNTPGRYINVYNPSDPSAAGHIIGPLFDNKVAENHSIYTTPVTFTETITLEPGQNKEASTIIIHNQTDGSSSFDDIWAGVRFLNPLPADYRPGTTFKSDEPYYPGDQTGIWLSHNRADKAAHVLADVQNITWQEMRTINGDSGGQGNPPLILHQADANSWYNQKLLGKE